MLVPAPPGGSARADGFRVALGRRNNGLKIANSYRRLYVGGGNDGRNVLVSYNLFRKGSTGSGRNGSGGLSVRFPVSRLGTLVLARARVSRVNHLP